MSFTQEYGFVFFKDCTCVFQDQFRDFFHIDLEYFLGVFSVNLAFLLLLCKNDIFFHYVF